MANDNRYYTNRDTFQEQKMFDPDMGSDDRYFVDRDIS